MNLIVRLKNPIFIIQLLLSIATPVLAYMGLTAQDLTTWGAVWDLIVSAFSNPYVVLLMLSSLWAALNDPTTKGVTDSETAMTYTEPK